MLWLFILSILIALLYMILMAAFLKGWYKPGNLIALKPAPKKKISILIPFRNEEAQISGIVNAIENQDYPKDKLETIFIDDHSTDNTLKLLQKYAGPSSHLKIISLPAGQMGKKAALRFALTVATGEILFLTDADSHPESTWCSSMTSYFSNEKIKLVLGPVILRPASTFFQKIQQMDFLSMVITGAGSAGIGRPVLAFGPNIAIRKDLYSSIIHKIKNHIPSGDDMFILEAVKQQKDAGIIFAKDKKAIVRSLPQAEISQLWNQRKRWVSKSGDYQDKDVIVTSLIVYLFNFIILSSLILLPLKIAPWWIFIALLSWKTIADMPLILAGARFFNIENIVPRFLFTQLFYFAYIALVVPAGLIGGFKWKNRQT